MKELAKKVLIKSGEEEEKNKAQEYEAFVLKAWEDITISCLGFNKNFEEFVNDLRRVEQKAKQEFEKE